MDKRTDDEEKLNKRWRKDPAQWVEASWSLHWATVSISWSHQRGLSEVIRVDCKLFVDCLMCGFIYLMKFICILLSAQLQNLHILLWREQPLKIFTFLFPKLLLVYILYSQYERLLKTWKETSSIFQSFHIQQMFHSVISTSFITIKILIWKTFVHKFYVNQSFKILEKRSYSIKGFLIAQEKIISDKMFVVDLHFVQLKM